MPRWVFAVVAAGSVIWVVWVAALIEQSPLALVPAIGVILAFGWCVGYWIGDPTFGMWTILGLAILSAAGAFMAYASGFPAPGLPLLVSTVPALLSAPLAYLGGEAAHRRRRRR